MSCKYMDNSCREEKMGCEGCAYYDENNTVAKIENQKITGMTINTKYAIGQKVWVLIENIENKEIELFSDTISSIVIYENKICYFLDELCDDIDENVLIEYENTEKLLKKIIDTDKKMNFKEENNAN